MEMGSTEEAVAACRILKNIHPWKVMTMRMPPPPRAWAATLSLCAGLILQAWPAAAQSAPSITVRPLLHLRPNLPAAVGGPARSASKRLLSSAERFPAGYRLRWRGELVPASLASSADLTVTSGDLQTVVSFLADGRVGLSHCRVAACPSAATDLVQSDPTVARDYELAFRNGRGVELRIDGAPVLEQTGPRTTQVEGLRLDATATDGELQLTAMEAVQEGTLQLSQVASPPDEDWAVIDGTLYENLSGLEGITLSGVNLEILFAEQESDPGTWVPLNDTAFDWTLVRDLSEMEKRVAQEIGQFNVKPGYIKAIKVHPAGGLMVLNGEEYPISVANWSGVRPVGIEDGDIYVAPLGGPIRTFDAGSVGATFDLRIFDQLRYADGRFYFTSYVMAPQCMFDGELYGCVPLPCRLDENLEMVCPPLTPEGERPFEPKACDDGGQGYVELDFSLDMLKWSARASDSYQKYQNNQELSIPILFNNPYIKGVELHAADVRLAAGDYIDLHAGEVVNSYSKSENGPDQWVDMGPATPGPNSIDFSVDASDHEAGVNFDRARIRCSDIPDGRDPQGIPVLNPWNPAIGVFTDAEDVVMFKVPGDPYHKQSLLVWSGMGTDHEGEVDVYARQGAYPTYNYQDELSASGGGEEFRVIRASGYASWYIAVVKRDPGPGFFVVKRAIEYRDDVKEQKFGFEYDFARWSDVDRWHADIRRSLKQFYSAYEGIAPLRLARVWSNDDNCDGMFGGQCMSVRGTLPDDRARCGTDWPTRARWSPVTSRLTPSPTRWGTASSRSRTSTRTMRMGSRWIAAGTASWGRTSLRPRTSIARARTTTTVRTQRARRLPNSPCGRTSPSRTELHR